MMRVRNDLDSSRSAGYQPPVVHDVGQPDAVAPAEQHYTWVGPGDIVEVPDELGLHLITMPGGGFSEESSVGVTETPEAPAATAPADVKATDLVEEPTEAPVAVAPVTEIDPFAPAPAA